MKVSINSRIIDGPWGGGNRAAMSIFERLASEGHEVVTDLGPLDIDVILMINPNTRFRSVSYGIDEIGDYLAVSPSTLLVHRINTSGAEQKGGGSELEDVLAANRLADHTVFISGYLRDLYVRKGFDPSRPHEVILNGADERLFNPERSSAYGPGMKMRLVTHHWSSNYMKGFDVYERLDLLLGEDPYKDMFEFTIIGNVPSGIDFRNTTIIAPISGNELADCIRAHHVYITATRNEPAGMHHIEGMRCGLPVLYLNSGALPEYCSPYGVEFTLLDFERKVMEVRQRYEELRSRVLDCPYTAAEMTGRYMDLFGRLMEHREGPFVKPGLLGRVRHKILSGPRAKLRRGRELIGRLKRHIG